MTVVYTMSGESGDHQPELCTSSEGRADEPMGTIYQDQNTKKYMFGEGGRICRLLDVLREMPIRH